MEAEFTAGHLPHLAAAGCVLNDIYREGGRPGIAQEGVRVTAAGGFDSDSWESTGISYSVRVSSPAPVQQLARLLAIVDDVTAIPRAAIRHAQRGRESRRLDCVRASQRQSRVVDHGEWSMLRSARAVARGTGSDCRAMCSSALVGLFGLARRDPVVGFPAAVWRGFRPRSCPWNLA